jgi:hypothetical protein
MGMCPDSADISDGQRFRMPAILFVCFAAAPLYPASAGSARTPSLDDLKPLVADLLPDAFQTRRSLEETFAVRMEPDGGTPAFATFRAEDIEIHNVHVDEIVYRAPRPGVEVTAGPIVELRLPREPCFNKGEVVGAYPALAMGSAPPPEDPNPTQYYRIENSEAVLSMGFPANGPHCLRSIVFSIKEP